MTIQRNEYYDLIDPRKGENDRNLGPGLRRNELSTPSITRLFDSVVCQTVQRRYGVEIAPQTLENTRLFFVSITLIFTAIVPEYLSLKTICSMPLCYKLEIEDRMCFTTEMDKVLLSLVVALVCMIVVMTIFHIAVYQYGKISSRYYFSTYERSDLVTFGEIREIAAHLELDSEECNQMNLQQYTEAIPFLLQKVPHFRGSPNRDLLFRIYKMQRMTEGEFVALFRREEATAFLRDFPETRAIYRIHLPERLRHLQSFFAGPLIEHPRLESRSSPASSSSTTDQFAVDRHKQREIIDDISQCRKFLDQFDLNDRSSLELAAEIIFSRPWLLEKLAQERVGAIISYFIYDDRITEVKNGLELRPDIKESQFLNLVLQATESNRLNILKYLINEISNIEQLGEIIEPLIRKTSQRYEREQMDFLLTKMVFLPTALYPSFNPFEGKKFVKHFQNYIDDTLSNISEQSFESIQKAVCLVRYYFHLINTYQIENREISPQYIYENLLLAILKYLENLSHLPAFNPVSENLNFLAAHLPLIRDFLQTGRTYYFPDRNYVKAYAYVNMAIDRKLEEFRN